MSSSLGSVHTLYLCYFGLHEPLVQTQVLPYLRQLAAAGTRVSLLTFEPELQRRWSADELAKEESRLGREGISWHYLPYHKRPSAPATAYDIVAGARLAARLVRRHRIGVLHARTHVPLAMALLVKRLTNCLVVFDLRGLIAEEYADAGVWREGSLKFRAIKRLERAGLARADEVIVLTRRMRDWLVARGLAAAERIEVIPCCVDFARFGEARADAVQGDEGGGASATEEALAARSSGARAGGERFEIIYAGAVTGLYLLEEMGRFFLEIRARRANAFFRVLTTAPPQDAARVLARAGLDAGDFDVGPVTAAEVPDFLRRARLGISFRKPTFSQIAASPTKIPEYLAAGLPVVSNAGIGDVDKLLEREKVGVVVRDFTAAEFARAAERALALAGDARTRARSVEVARRHFDLETVGGEGYANVYRRIGERLTPGSA